MGQVTLCTSVVLPGRELQTPALAVSALWVPFPVSPQLLKKVLFLPVPLLSSPLCPPLFSPPQVVCSPTHGGGSAA